MIDPSTSLNILTRIASDLIGPDITPVKAMTEEESKEWHKYHSKTLENGNIIISDDIINMPADEAKALCDMILDDGTYIDLDPSMSLNPAVKVKEGQRVLVSIITEN